MTVIVPNKFVFRSHRRGNSNQVGFMVVHVTALILGEKMLSSSYSVVVQMLLCIECKISKLTQSIN